MDDRFWFRAKPYGYGSGLPIHWKGWVALALHAALIVAIAFLFEDRLAWMIAAVSLAALLPLPLYRARTRGGWRWRWGDDGGDEKRA